MNAQQNLKERLDQLAIERHVNVRVNSDGLRIYKYSKKVFFKQLWNKYPDLMEARGIVFNDAGDLVSYPFTKVFNHGENDAGFHKSDHVCAVEKINGFLGVATWDFTHGKLLITSSGSFESPFVDMAKEYLDNEDVATMCHLYGGNTFMFEICHPKDPHIINEMPGAYLIGMRPNILDSDLVPESELDSIFNLYLSETKDMRRPKWSCREYGDVLRECKDPTECLHEGYICRKDGQEVKVKSQNYLIKKFLSRSKKDFSVIWTNPDQAKQDYPEEFYLVIDELPKFHSAEEWAALDDKARLKTLQEIF